MFGALQQGQADVSASVALMTSFPVADIVHVSGPVLWADLKVIYSTGELKFKKLDVTNVLLSISRDTTYFWLITLLVLAAYVAMATAVLRRRWDKVLDSVASGIAVIADALSCAITFAQLHHSSVRITWLSCVIAIFVFINGYVCNLTSVDRVAVVPPPDINNIDDLLFDEHFTHVRVVMFRSLFYYQYMLDSSPDSKIMRLFNRMNASSTNCPSMATCNFVDLVFTQDNIDTAQRLIVQAIRDGGAVLLLPDECMNGLFNVILCALNPPLMRNIRLSRDPISENTLVYYFNRRLHRNVLKYLDYVIRSVLEFARIINVKRRIIDAIIEKHLNNIFPINWQTFVCLANPKRKEIPPPLHISTIRNACIFFSCFIAFSFVVLFTEVLYGTHVGRRRHRMRRTIRKVIVVNRAMPSQVNSCATPMSSSAFPNGSSSFKTAWFAQKFRMNRVRQRDHSLHGTVCIN